MKARVCEAFYSIQGEGRFVGVPSVFLRMYGCNFKCRGFGMPRGELANDYNLIAKDHQENPDKYKVLKDLPLVHKGCDSYASWDPRFKKFTTDYQLDDLVDELLSLTPEGKWTCNNGQDVHLVITGGEPLLGWQRMYIDLFQHPKMGDLKNVTFETNTTQELRDDFRNYISTKARFHTTWSCSPKLTVSGELWGDAIKPEIAYSYFTVPGTYLYLKFVVADEVDVEEVTRAVNEYKGAKVECPVYCMAVGGCYEEYQENAKTVAKLAMGRGWRYTPRLHVDIFGNSWGT